LPVPHALFRHKSGGGFDKSGTIFNRLSEEETAGKQLKGYREGYIGAYQGNQLPAHETTPKVLGTHNTVEDKAQRPKEEVGGVYSWEAIAAGTVLRSELRVRGNVKEDLDKRQAEWWLKLNSDDLRLGSSRKDDYGSVTLEAGQVAKFSPAPQAKGNKLTVWLLSDLLLREPSLRATTFIERLCEVLEDKLEVKLEEWKPGEGLLGSLLRARRVESWQVSWGLPRPSLLATQAGSCVVFKIKDELDGTGARQLEDKLKKLEREGVGERRAEGYGQVRFNDPLTTEEVNKWAVTQRGDDKDAAESQAVALTPAEEEIARRVETEVWREEMRRGILAFASDPEKRRENLGLTVKGGESYPPSTQLSGLRDVISHLRNEADKGGITAWLGHLKDTRNRREKWGGALKKIEGLIDEPNGVWELIDSDNTLKLTLSSEAERRLRRELWAEAVRGLIDACVRAQKRETE
jgi:CRISPR-associated protein Csx10